MQRKIKPRFFKDKDNLLLLISIETGLVLIGFGPVAFFAFLAEYYVLGIALLIFAFIPLIVVIVVPFLPNIYIIFDNTELSFIQSKQTIDECAGIKCMPKKIPYSSIEAIRLIHSAKSDHKQVILDKADKEVKDVNLYLEFILRDEDSKWFTFSSFCDTERIKIINLINEKTGLTKSYNQLVKELLVHQVDEEIDLQ